VAKRALEDAPACCCGLKSLESVPPSFSGGRFTGARKAADYYFNEHSVRMLLNRIDYSG
jgi:hypothetical protein